MIRVGAGYGVGRGWKEEKRIYDLRFAIYDLFQAPLTPLANRMNSVSSTRARFLAWMAVWFVLAASDCLGAAGRWNREDETFLIDLARRGCLYFWENADSRTGLVKDRNRTDEPDERTVGSIAATGFGLTALCLAHERRWLPRSDVEERVRATLRFLRHELPSEHGFFYHFVDVRTGGRVWNCEVSSIDTGLLLCGVLKRRKHFGYAEIRGLARQNYERVDWTWLLTTNQSPGHGRKPESGMLKNDWDSYCELMLLYLLAMGSPTHSIPADSWR